MEITIIIVVVTCVVSFVAFSNQAIMDKLIFYPPAVNNDKEWYRFFTCGLIHADIGHLAFNMIAFYYFGQIIEIYFKEIFHEMGNFMYVVLYISALAVCLLPTYSKQKENYHYRSLGASGAVSAIVFVGILLRPTDGIHFIFLPRNTAIPGFVFGPIYLIATAYLDKRGKGGINHSAHLWGALYGVAFLIVTSYFLSDYRPLTQFIEQVKAYL